MVKVVALKGFTTSDSTGQIAVKQGDVFEVKESTAVLLACNGYVKKYRPTKSEDK